MILDLKKLKRSGKESSDFSFEYNPDVALIDIPSAEFDGAVAIVGTVTLTGEHSAYVEGEAKFSIKGDCTRCLKETINTYIARFEEAVSPDDENGYPVKNDTIDLSKIVDDAIMMNVPIAFLCSDECKGICSGCGVNLNDEDCKCKN